MSRSKQPLNETRGKKLLSYSFGLFCFCHPAVCGEVFRTPRITHHPLNATGITAPSMTKSSVSTTSAPSARTREPQQGTGRTGWVVPATPEICPRAQGSRHSCAKAGAFSQGPPHRAVRNVEAVGAVSPYCFETGVGRACERLTGVSTPPPVSVFVKEQPARAPTAAPCRPQAARSAPAQPLPRPLGAPFARPRTGNSKRTRDLSSAAGGYRRTVRALGAR